MFKLPISTTILRIDFPALDNLVTYLKESRQQEVDALTAKVIEMTGRLKQSNTGLQDSIDKEK